VTAQKLVDDFNASQSDIHVTYRSMPWTNWYETYVTAIASGSACSAWFSCCPGSCRRWWPSSRGAG